MMKNDIKSPAILHYRTHLMGLAAIWIYLFHEWIPLAPNIPIIGFIENFIKQIGFFGVDIFFFLSGMGLIYAMEKHSLSVFYQRRFLRILPPYILTAILLMFAHSWTLTEFLKNLFGITFFTKDIYTLLWFVPAITVFYLLFPLYYTIFKKRKYKTIFTISIIFLWLILSLLAAGHMRLDLFGFTNRIPIFLTGILIGWFCKNGAPSFPKWTRSALCVIFAIGLVLAYYTNYKGLYLLVPVSNCCVPNFLMAFSGVFIFSKLFQLCDIHGKTPGKWLLNIFRFFGTISFEFYCVQEFIGEKMKTLLSGLFWDSITNLIVILAVTIAALILHWISQQIGKLILRKQK